MKYSARHSQNLMKFVIILYLCSFVGMENNCHQIGYGPYEYPSYPDCILDGYRVSHVTLKRDHSLEEINEKKLAIKFYCKEIGETT